MFNLSPKTSFGPSIDILASRVVALPPMTGTGRDDSRTFSDSQAAVIQCPPGLLKATRELGGSQTRLAAMQVGNAHFGIAMVYRDGHFAAAFFDLGDEKCQSMARQAVKDGEVHLLLSSDDDFLLLVPQLTSGCRAAFTTAARLGPASVSEFTSGLQGIEGALRRTETWEEMGIDASSLKSITLSVCVPGLDGEPEVEIRHAGSINHTLH